MPTKALINEVKSNLIGALQEVLKEKNYRVVTAAGDLVLQQDHHFIFVMTPERLHHMMIERENIHIDFLFIDEAHKISIKEVTFPGRDIQVILELANRSEPRCQPVHLAKLAARYNSQISYCAWRCLSCGIPSCEYQTAYRAQL